MKPENQINPADRAMAVHWRRESEVFEAQLAKETDTVKRTLLVIAIAEAHNKRLQYLARTY